MRPFGNVFESSAIAFLMALAVFKASEPGCCVTTMTVAG